MQQITISDIEPGEMCMLTALVKSIRLRTTSKDSLYLDIELADKTGTIKAKKWDATREEFQSMPPNSFVNVVAHGDEYRGTSQLKIKSIAPVSEEDIDPSDFMPVSRFDIDQMVDYLAGTAGSLDDEHYSKLWRVILDDKEFMAQFTRCPAAMSYHHVFLGGLLEHTCEVIRLCDAIAGIRPELDRALLLSGAFIHDMGKIQEYTSGPAFQNRDRGMLLSHIYIVTEMLDGWAAQIEDFPQDKLDLLKHIALSHHGQREWGATVEPSFPEAIVVHFTDNIDAKLNNAKMTIAEDVSDEGDFTAQPSRMLRRRIYKRTLRPEPDDYNPFGNEDGAGEKTGERKNEKRPEDGPEQEDGPNLFHRQ
ncbi:MAG: HD domain-containing protein [Planctomycetota bacterium]|nr:HD domain-containing protein [Planctomycetota bacterium]